MRTMNHEDIYRRALRTMPGGVNSPVRAFNGVGGTPVFADTGRRQKIRTADGRVLTDYCCSWGAMILGHANPEVTAAIRARAAKGTTFGIATEPEVAFAERIASLVPGAEMVRAVSSGTEAVMSAIRLARGVTGRPAILKFDGCYHGHSDAMLVKSGSGVLTAGMSSSAGVPRGAAADTLSIPYNDAACAEEVFAKHGDRIAAVIVEPVAGNMGLVPPAPGFLRKLRACATRHGALLVCDEVIDGFRFGLSTYCSLYAGVRPDLTTLGKVIGGGLPLAALCGRRKYMSRLAPSGDVYQAGTLSGNPLAVAAGLKTLDILERDMPYGRMAELGAALEDGIGETVRRYGLPVKCNRLGGVFTIFCTGGDVTDLDSAKRCDTGLYAKIFHGMLKRGIYLAPSQFECNFISAAHTAGDIDEAIARFAETCASL